MKKNLIVLIIVISLLGCKKKTETPQLEVTLTNIAGTYRITAHTSVTAGITQDLFNGGTIGGMAYESIYEPCVKDDTYTFSTNGNLTRAEGATTCNPTNADTMPFSVNTAAKTITIDGTTGNVINLTSAAFQVTGTETISGISSTHTITYTK